MSERWVVAGKLEEMRFEPGAAVRIEDHWVGIFRLGANYFAIDNACPHAGAPLCDGHFEQSSGKVVCSLHLWAFDVRTGACDTGQEWNVRTYPTRERDGSIEIDLGGA